MAEHAEPQGRDDRVEESLLDLGGDDLVVHEHGQRALLGRRLVGGLAARQPHQKNRREDPFRTEPAHARNPMTAGAARQASLEEVAPFPVVAGTHRGGLRWKLHWTTRGRRRGSAARWRPRRGDLPLISRLVPTRAARCCARHTKEPGGRCTGPVPPGFRLDRPPRSAYTAGHGAIPVCRRSGQARALRLSERMVIGDPDR